jgi:DNA-binding response OmpR family regulator
MLLRVLDEENYSVRPASSGAEGLQLAQAENFQLLLLDGDLPAENANDFCAKFTLSHPDVPVIIMVRSSEAPSPGFKSIGVCLEKPLDFERLLRTVRELLAPTNPPTRNQVGQTIRSSVDPAWKLKPSPIG